MYISLGLHMVTYCMIGEITRSTLYVSDFLITVRVLLVFSFSFLASPLQCPAPLRPFPQLPGIAHSIMLSAQDMIGREFNLGRAYDHTKAFGLSPS